MLHHNGDKRSQSRFCAPARARARLNRAFLTLLSFGLLACGLADAQRGTLVDRGLRRQGRGLSEAKCTAARISNENFLARWTKPKL